MELTKIRVGIVGVTGYGGRESVKILLRHPGVDITLASSNESSLGEKLYDIYPELRGLTELVCEKTDIAQIIKRCDVVLLGAPHGVAMKMAPELLKAGLKVVDYSGDFRIQDIAVFEAAYGIPQAAPQLLKTAVYGFPELDAPAVSDAQLLSNPGCFPTTVVLGLAPLLVNKMAEPRALSVSVTGTSGAGRKASLAMLLSEVEGTVKPYKVGTHQHVPEMNQALSKLAGEPFRINFVPELGGFSRGILSTLNIRLKKPAKTEELVALYQQFYAGKKMVRVYPKGRLPELKTVVNTSFCDIGIHCDGTDCLVFSAVDNLLKGQAGQGIQSLNLMFGFDETTGLL